MPKLGNLCIAHQSLVLAVGLVIDLHFWHQGSMHDTVVKTEIKEINSNPLFGDQTINVALLPKLLHQPSLAMLHHLPAAL